MNQKFFLLLVSLFYFPNEVFAQEVEGIFQTGQAGVIFKNVKCIDDKWSISIVNRNDYGVNLNIVFYTVDQDGDPLVTHGQYGQYLSGKSRRVFLLNEFQCNIPFKSLKYAIR